MQSITFSNYKSFEKEQVFEIKPITLVIGRNNSGKTALIQLPLMINAWLNDRNGFLSLAANGIEFAKQMKELVFNKSKTEVLKIAFKPRRNLEGIVHIQLLGYEYKISYLEWKFEGETRWKAEWYKENNNFKVTKGNHVEYHPSLDKVIGGILPKEDIIFSRLVGPVVHYDKYGNEYNKDILLDQNTLYRELEYYFHINNISYLTGIRHTFIDANLSFNELKYKTDDITGEFAAQYLYKHDDLLKNVQNWYIENMEGWGISLDKNPTNEGFYLYIEDFTKSNGVKIPITQTGQGITQILPLITKAYLNNERTPFRMPKGSDNSNVITTTIEQPELHLHPAAHGNLVELFAESAIKNGHNYILETHSEVMLLRVRRLVAEGTLKPEQVAIYWVDTEEGSEGKRSFLKKIEVDEFGMLDDWPEGVFADDHEEVLAIRRAQRRKEEVK